MGRAEPHSGCKAGDSYLAVTTAAQTQGTDQLEVSDANGALLIHVLLVLVLNQTLHQVPRVNLVVCHILGKTGHAYTLFVIINDTIYSTIHEIVNISNPSSLQKQAWEIRKDSGSAE